MIHSKTDGLTNHKVQDFPILVSDSHADTAWDEMTGFDQQGALCAHEAEKLNPLSLHYQYYQYKALSEVVTKPT